MAAVAPLVFLGSGAVGALLGGTVYLKYLEAKTEQVMDQELEKENYSGENRNAYAHAY